MLHSCKSNFCHHVLKYLRTLAIARMVRHRVTRRLPRLQTMCNVLKYRTILKSGSVRLRFGCYHFFDLLKFSTVCLVCVSSCTYVKLLIWVILILGLLFENYFCKTIIHVIFSNLPSTAYMFQWIDTMWFSFYIILYFKRVLIFLEMADINLATHIFWTTY